MRWFRKTSIKWSVRRLRLESNDWVIVSVDRPITQEQASWIKASLAGITANVVVAADGIELTIVGPEASDA